MPRLCVSPFVALVTAIFAFHLPSVLLAAEAITPAELALVKQAEKDRIDNVARIYGAVVAVYGNDREGGGSGVLIDSTGLALTNHHVVAAAGMSGWGGLAKGRLYRWNLVGADPGGDVAIIRLVGDQPFPKAPLGNSRQVRVGDSAFALGNPFTLAHDQTPTFTLGIVSGVDRYQYGAAANTLVYGRCIQVDSSINPGNSGGPLFNSQGRLIGINGRASFEERGRVNVGAGYAISLEQCLNFFPDLLATKLAQHGTLDAQFGDREIGVVCHTIQLDSNAAEAGLRLGDRLIEFEGEQVHSGNQFTNIVSTLPAGWPASFEIERDGARHRLTVRLTALPYESEAPPEASEKPAPEKPDPEKSAPKSKAPPNPKENKPRGAPLNLGKAGQIRDAKLNAQMAEWLVEESRRELGLHPLPAQVRAIKLSDRLLRSDQEVGQMEVTLAVDGRFHQRITLDKSERSCGFNGVTYWRQTKEGVERDALPRILVDPLLAQNVVLASLLRSQGLAKLGQLEHHGSDKAAGLLCHRLRLSWQRESELFVWLRVTNEQGQFSCRPVKIGPSLDGETPLEGVLFPEWRETQGIFLPGKRLLAAGLAERTQLVCEPLKREFETQLVETLFDPPAGKARDE